MSSVPAYDDCVSKRGAIRQLSRLKKGHSSAGPSALYKERTSRGLSWPGRARGERAARRPRSGAPSCRPRPTHRRTAPYWPPRRPPRTCSSSRIQLCSPLSQDCSPRRCVPAPVPVPCVQNPCGWRAPSMDAFPCACPPSYAPFPPPHVAQAHTVASTGQTSSPSDLTSEHSAWTSAGPSPTSNTPPSAQQQQRLPNPLAACPPLGFGPSAAGNELWAAGAPAQATPLAYSHFPECGSAAAVGAPAAALSMWSTDLRAASSRPMSHVSDHELPMPPLPPQSPLGP